MMKNKSFSKPSLLAVAILSASCMTGSMALGEENVNSIAEAFTEGDASLIFRYRYENVDQDNALDNANASTLKTRLNFKTKSWNDFSAMVEVDSVSNVFVEDYNSTTNGQTAYSVVADPTGTDVNQAWLQYTGFDDTLVRYGNQRINLDNQRFVGGVGWRQNEQTYDSLVIANSSISKLTATYAYIWDVNRIFGPDSPKSEIKADTHLFNFAYSGLPFGKLSAYSYLLDAQESPTINTQTIGVRLAGSKLGNDKNWSYELEYADQSDYDDRPTSLSADYFHGSLGYTVNGMTFGAGYEVLSGDANNAGQAFTTPLATLHKFNGWADQFLGTPGDGLEDTYLKFSTKLSDYKFTVMYHDFSAEDSGNDYGSEIDLSLVRKFSKNYSLVLKYAAYSAGDIKVDANKLWLMFTASY
jgi:hypothetical protein